MNPKNEKPQGQSSSPYINGLIRVNMEQIFKDPKTLMTLQSELLQELNEKNLSLDEMTDEEAENAQGDMEKILANLVSKVLVQAVTKSYSQFMDMHGQSALQIKTVILPQNVLPVLINNQVRQYSQRPELKDASDNFVAKISKKFETTIMMEDDVEMTPSVTYAKIMLLENGSNYCIQASKREPSKQSAILADLIRNDKDIFNALWSLIQKSMTPTPNEAKPPMFVLKSALINFLDEMKSNKTFTAELDWTGTADHIESDLVQYYIIENGIETKMAHPKDLYALLKEKQFSPESSMNDLQRKLKLV